MNIPGMRIKIKGTCSSCGAKLSSRIDIMGDEYVLKSEKCYKCGKIHRGGLLTCPRIRMKFVP